MKGRTTMMTETQQKLRKLRLTLICVAIICLMGLSIYSAHILLNHPEWVKGERTESVVVIPSARVNVQTPAMNLPSYTARKAARVRPYPAAATHTMHTQPMSNTSFHIHQTSSADVHHVGGGGGGGFHIASTASSSQRGIHQNALAYSGAIYVPTAHNSVSAVGAGFAPEVVNEKMGVVTRRARKTNDGDYPEDRPDITPDVDEDMPVGDVAWIFLLLLAAGYAGCIYHARRNNPPMREISK